MFLSNDYLRSGQYIDVWYTIVYSQWVNIPFETKISHAHTLRLQLYFIILIIVAVTYQKISWWGEVTFGTLPYRSPLGLWPSSQGEWHTYGMAHNPIGFAFDASKAKSLFIGMQVATYEE